jgi:hypothetical protein
MVEASDGVLYTEQIDEYCAKLREKSEKFFASAGKAPLEVYRIEKFEPIAQDPAHFGKFYDGDSYVVVKMNQRDYDIHYWHGKNATSVSAFKSHNCSGRNGLSCCSVCAAVSKSQDGISPPLAIDGSRDRAIL